MLVVCAALNRNAVYDHRHIEGLAGEIKPLVQHKCSFIVAVCKGRSLEAPAIAVVNVLGAILGAFGVAVVFNDQRDFGGRFSIAGLIRKSDRYVLLSHSERGGICIDTGDSAPAAACACDFRNDLALGGIDGDELLLDRIRFFDVVQLAVQAKSSTVRGRNGVEFLGTQSKRANRLRFIDAEEERAAFTGHSVGVNGTLNSTPIHHFTGDIRVTDVVSHNVTLLDGEGVGAFVIAPTAAAGACGPMGRFRNCEVLNGCRKCPHGHKAQHHAQRQQKTDEPLFHYNDISFAF